TFNPRAFEQFWRPFQPAGNLVFRELPADVQNKMLAEMAKVVDFQLGNEFINGEYGEEEGKFFNGILTRIVADTDTVKVDGAQAITESNIIASFKSVAEKLPKVLQKSTNRSKVKFFVSMTNGRMYDYVLTEKPYKGVDYTGMSPERFKGYQIVPLADWPDNVIVAAYATSGMDSNFWAGVDYADDSDVVQIDKLTNAGEKYFFKMLMKADTNIVFGEDIVLYDGRG
ncbi:MAG: phage major capsid protein, partial [Firmicutes bacterium]|nr:phage major capsid protein [Bacillota bacterium]